MIKDCHRLLVFPASFSCSRENIPIEKLIEDVPLKYLNMFYGNDTIFMQREIYKYSKSTHNDTISFIDYENNQLKKVVLVSKRAKESLHISLVSEK